MALSGYEVINDTKTLDTNVAVPQGRSMGAPSGKKILSAGYYDDAYGKPALTVTASYTSSSGTTHYWSFMCNDPNARSIECYIVVADA
jgi:hypothetical protein